MTWVLVEKAFASDPDVVWRDLGNGTQESRLVSSFAPEDPDYAEVMALVAQKPAE